MRKKRIVTKPFDRDRMPPKQNLLAMLLLWPYCWFYTKRAKLKIKKVRMSDLKPPYLVLCNHLSFTDFCVTPLALFPHRANYISELEGFENYGEWVYRQIGCLGTRKFINDLALVKNIKKVIQHGGIMVVYPEARYANVGSSSIMPESVGKLAKSLSVPLVTINMKGNYLQSPIWNVKLRKEAKLEATVTQLLTAEELAQTPLDTVNSMIKESLHHDEYAWQYDTKLAMTNRDRAEGLECALYQCPVCQASFCMDTDGAEIFCSACCSRWRMTEYGQLEQISGHNISRTYTHIPDWYEWERAQVIHEIENGNYNLDILVKVEALPNAVNFIDLGNGRLSHSQEGFSLCYQEYGEPAPKTWTLPPISTLSVHTEYNYRGKGQCITLSTLDNTYFLFPLEPGFNATKIQFATEYLYEKAKKSSRVTEPLWTKGREIKC